MRLGGFVISMGPKRTRNDFCRLILVDQKGCGKNLSLMFCDCRELWYYQRRQ